VRNPPLRPQKRASAPEPVADLSTYNARRDFRKTNEPKGAHGKATGNSFVVQKHDATRLHWDFRLEIDGVLKSWAVTRGPSLDPQDKRLAVRTEDHPLGYGGFEGTIPKGEYGGGTVMLWDRGTWAPLAGKSAKDLEEGHLHFTLEGERMKGEWMLIRLKPRGKEKNENWLLRKVGDEYTGSSEELVERALTSVTTGRSMEEIASGKKPPRKASKRPLPKFESVQLATLVDHVPDGSDWIHETKYDGYRALIAMGSGKASLFTRTGLDWSDKFPTLIASAKALAADSALIDGEIVVLDADGKPSFGALQESIKTGAKDVIFMAFDILAIDGEDVRPRTNLARKALLQPLIPPDGAIKFADHIVGSGEPLFAAMCAAGLEGIVSKRADAPYRGKRTQNWLKVKCTLRQEFVIIGWTDSKAGTKRGFGSLLLAVNEGDARRYVGKVGTGFGEATMTTLREKFDQIGTEKPAATVPTAARRGAHWIEPKLVAEIAFAARTADGILRHSSFLGLRGDKPARDVVEERPVARPEPSTVKISNRDRVIFPEADLTKGDLADYYDAMAPLILQTAAGRPLSLVRCPQGRAKQCFFQRHGAENLGDAIKTIEVPDKAGKNRAYLYVEDRTGLLECVQMGSIELHGWGAMARDVEHPDRLIFDLDPDEGLDFEDVKKAAREIRQHLSDLGLVSFAMLSGGKGLHVIAPITPAVDWPRFTEFAHRFAEALATADPDRFVATMSKAKRKGRIFIDWLRNQRGSTAVLPYSVRARENAPVAAPISWAELDDMKGGGAFTLRARETLLKRAAGSALKGWGIARQSLPDY